MIISVLRFRFDFKIYLITTAKMKILKQIDNNKMSVLGYENYISQIDGVVSYGYVCSDDLTLPYMVKKRGFFKFVQLPSKIEGGNGDNTGKRQFIEDAVKELCRRENPDAILTLNTAICSVHPEKAEYCKFGSYIIDLQKTEDEIFAEIHSKHRNVIRKAEKDGLTVHSGVQYADVCYEQIIDTYKRQNRVSYTKEHFEKLKKLGENVDFWVVKNGDDIQGCAVLLWSKGFSSFYLHGGSCSHPHGGAMNLLHWEAIKKMKERGVLKYDFVGARVNPEPGSKLEGIQRFKSRFGGEMKVGYMWRYVNRPLRYKLYMLMFNLYLKYVKHDNTFSDIIKEERAKGNF